MDITGFAKVLGGVKRLEGSGANRPTNVSRITGTAVSDSEDGKVLVRLDAQVFSGDGSQYVELATSDNVREGDSVYVDMVGADGKGKSLMISGSIGSGDRQQSEIDDAARAAAVAWDWADEAHEAAEAAQESADEAAVAASAAQTSADVAAVAAGAAQTSANAANAAANSAITQLSIVEDVSGTLDWISKHGTYVATADTIVRDGTVYFERVGNDYVPIAMPDPEANPSIEGWYVLDVTDSQSEYIMAHIAVTSAGLWVLTAGIDGQSAATSSGYKVLLSNSGMTVYDGTGTAVATYGGSGISFAQDRSFYIGDEDAYIFFDGNGHITIGGTVTLGSNKTLSELLADVDTATQRAEEAMDMCTISITSTGGTVFKQNRGVSTTLVVTIFTGDGLRITDANALRSRFGNGAYLQWKWKDSPEDEFTVLINSDPRIGAGGFTLTVSPSDISTQAIIDCELIF